MRMTDNLIRESDDLPYVLRWEEVSFLQMLIFFLRPVDADWLRTFVFKGSSSHASVIS